MVAHWCSLGGVAAASQVAQFVGHGFGVQCSGGVLRCMLVVQQR
jgi:hypothetical protein